MTYNEHRYIPTSKFKNQCVINTFSPTIQAGGKIVDGTAETTQTRYFSFLQESGLMSGEQADDRVLAESGLVLKENEIQVIFKWNQTLYNSLEQRKKIIVSYNGKKFTITSFINVGGEKTYLSCSLKAVQTNA